jgi:hypothetical protein
MGGECSTYGNMRGACRALVGRYEGNNHLEDRGLEGRIILKRIFKRKDGKTRLCCSGLGYGQVVSSCESGNEHSGSVKCGKFLDYLRIC